MSDCIALYDLFWKALALELAAIRVNVVMRDVVDTPRLLIVF